MNRLCIAAVAALALGAASPAWARAYQLAPAPAEGQTVKYDKGVATLVSTRPDTEVWATPPGSAVDGRITLAVGVANDGDASAEIDQGDVEVFTVEGVKLAVYDLAALEKEAKAKQAWVGFGAALAGGLAAANSNRYDASDTYNRSLAATNAVVASAGDAASGKVDDDMSQNILKRTTVAPGETGGGYVVIQKPPKGASAIRVQISFGGDLHELRFDLK
jgi:hypothetical protein